MKINLRTSLIVGLMLALIPVTVRTQSTSGPSPIYPNKPIRMIVGFTPGSATDITARIFAQKFNEAWGVPVIVENIVGAGGSVGVARVAKRPPAGYTLASAPNGPLTMPPSLHGHP